MNKLELVVGSLPFFTKWLEVNGVGVNSETSHLHLYHGMKVILDKYIPKDRAILMVDGVPEQIFKMKTWRTKKETASNLNPLSAPTQNHAK